MTTDIGALQREYVCLQQKRNKMQIIFNDLSGTKYASNIHASPPDGSIQRPEGDTSPPVSLSTSDPVTIKTVAIEKKQTYTEFLDSITPQVIGNTKCIMVQKGKDRIPRRKRTKSASQASNSLYSYKPCSNNCHHNAHKDYVDNNQLKTGHSDYDSFSTRRRNSFEAVNNQQGTKEQKSVQQDAQDETDKGDKESDIVTETEKASRMKNSRCERPNLEVLANFVCEMTGDISTNIEDSSVDQQTVIKADTQKEEPKGTVNACTSESDKLSGSNRVGMGMQCIAEQSNAPRSDCKREGSDSKGHSKTSVKAENDTTVNVIGDDKPKPEDSPDSPAILPVSLTTYKFRRDANRLTGRSISLSFDPSFTEALPSVSPNVKANIYHHFYSKKRHLSVDSGNTLAQQGICKILNPFPVQHLSQNRIKAGMKLGLYRDKKCLS